jgi:glucose 1-dehydrogenase
MTAYAASKAALESLTRGLACEYAPDFVRVNAIAPGVVPVERMAAAAFSDAKVVDMWTPCIPVGRLGTVEDVAHATLLLATSEWMTGTVLTVDGGMMARANMPIRPRPPPPPSPPRPGRPGGGFEGIDGGGDGLLKARLSSPGIIFEVPSAT